MNDLTTLYLAVTKKLSVEYLAHNTMWSWSPHVTCVYHIKIVMHSAFQTMQLSNDNPRRTHVQTYTS